MRLNGPCPVCRGEKRFNNATCMMCEGAGEVDYAAFKRTPFWDSITGLFVGLALLAAVVGTVLVGRNMHETDADRIEECADSCGYDAKHGTPRFAAYARGVCSCGAQVTAETIDGTGTQSKETP